MKKFIESCKNLILVVLILSLSFGVGYGYKGLKKPEEVVVEQEEKFDLKLPGEVEKTVVTVDEIEARIQDIGELSTYSGSYTRTLGKEEMRYLLDKIPILGTTNEITITCDGVVKVGYNLSDISVKVDNDKIYISIPEAKLHDNYIIWDSIACKEKNCILNPINFAQYQDLATEIERAGLKTVTQKGIYKKAEDNLKVLLEAFLDQFDGYSIVYM